MEVPGAALRDSFPDFTWPSCELSRAASALFSSRRAFARTSGSTSLLSKSSRSFCLGASKRRSFDPPYGCPDRKLVSRSPGK